MSFNANDINLSNYEEYFILYMDDELSASEKKQVENFIALHPHLGEELQVLLSLKMPVENIGFAGKKDLLSAAMKMTLVDEELLLYVDGELAPLRKTAVEQKICVDKDYALQHALLMQTKLDATETISHPNKKELYRHTEKVFYFPLWMRVAVAIILILSGALYFISGQDKNSSNLPIVKSPGLPQLQKPFSVPQQQLSPVLVPPVIVQKSTAKKSGSVVALPVVVHPPVDNLPGPTVALQNLSSARTKTERIPVRVKAAATQHSVAYVGINKTITRVPVTTTSDSTYHKQNTQLQSPDTADWAVESGKKTKGKGFLRRVSRFIERNTGIGTVNADNELLVGAVALKLK